MREKVSVPRKLLWLHRARELSPFQRGQRIDFDKPLDTTKWNRQNQASWLSFTGTVVVFISRNTHYGLGEIETLGCRASSRHSRRLVDPSCSTQSGEAERYYTPHCIYFIHHPPISTVNLE